MIRAEGSQFKDEHGRTLLLRGVNLGGSSKLPLTPGGATDRRESFFEHRTVSFTGRPFPLDEAGEHFARLQAWGVSLLRLVVTWEAVEHAGPGCYDEAYLDYLRALVQRAGEHDLAVFVDFHQDVWSRFCGGDGAPGWTLEAAGFELARLAESGAALVHALHGDALPRMIWPTNGTKLAAATMFTLFFGGDDFAPATRVDGEPVQGFLQRHYLDAARQVSRRLCDLPNVLGYEVMNEPLAGYIGWRDLRACGGSLKLGPCPSPLEAMLLGAGIPQVVAVWRMGPLGLRRGGTRRLNAGGARAWRGGCECVWRQNGVWDLDAAGRAQLLRPDHFARVRARAVDFAQDYYRPFANRFASAVREAHPHALVFVGPEPEHAPPRWGAQDAEGIVYAPHWYDGFVLMMKHYSRFLAADARTAQPVLGPGRIRRSFAAQLAALRREARERLGDVPVLLGEFGIPFDLDARRAYRSGDFSAQIAALDRTFQALEANLLSGTLWNYTADNTNARGDGWNDEDLSIFSRDQAGAPGDMYSGARAAAAFVRPYPRATAGEPLSVSFDLRTRVFRFVFRHDASAGPTEIFVPALHYPQGYAVQASDGRYEIAQAEQTLLYVHSLARAEHTLVIRPRL